MQVDRYKIHDIEVVVDRLKVDDGFRTRLSQSVQQTLKMGKDLMFVAAEPSEGVDEKESKNKFTELYEE